MGRVITLTTDFGMADAFVGTMKGVILSVNPEASIVDLCHSIEPQNVAQAAFVLSTAYRYFPDNTIHLVVVDPGVGSVRRAIILRTPTFIFVAPDNGVLSYILDDASPSATIGEGLQYSELGAGLKAVTISNPRFWLAPLSATFHGRDIFAPVAGYLSLAIPIHEFGEEVSRVSAFPLPRPEVVADGVLLGHVLHVDRFGNLITDVKAEGLPADRVRIKVGGRSIEGISSCYEEGGELLALMGSSGNLEVAAKNKNAAQMLGAKVGDEITITWT